jgi:hypothetical protein
LLIVKELIMAEVSSKTPRYVLRHGLQLVSPSLSGNHTFVAGSEVADSQVADSRSSPVAPSVIFGFTDKPQYDAFLQGDTKHLTPYPLVKRFLMDQLDQVEHRTGTKLLVVDALDPNQRVMQATTFEAALKSLQDGQHLVPITHRLIRDDVDDASCHYRIESTIADD